MWLIRWLIKVFDLRDVVSNLIRGVIASILYELSHKVRDEDIENLEKQIEGMIEKRIRNFAPELQELIRAAVRPLLDVIFEALKQTDDVARFLADVIKKVG